MDERIIRAKLEHIKRAVDARRWPIEGWEARTADHLAPGEYRFDGDWQPVAVGASWPATKTLFLRAQTELPAGMPPEELVLSFDMVGLEGLLSVNGRPYAGLDPNHMRVPAPAADRLELEAEFTCWGAALHRPELRRERAFLRDAALVQVDREVEAAFYDLSFVWEASQHAPDARRRDLLHAALEEALLAVDLTAPRERFTADLAAARRGLQARLAAIAPDPEGGRVFLTGHSHIDVAWLWPLRETVRKCGRTFSTACRLMEQYPDYHFACSQPQLYAYTREHYPTLYAEMRRWIEQVLSRTQVPMYALVTARIKPLLLPYAQAGQLSALLGGAADASEYGIASEGPQWALPNSQAYLAYLAVLVLAAIATNVAYLARKRVKCS